MNNPDHQSGLAVGAASMGVSTPLVTPGSYPQAVPQGYPPSAYPVAQPGFQAVYPPSIPQDHQSGLAVGAASMGVSTPPVTPGSYPQAVPQGHPPSAYPVAQPGFQAVYPPSNPQDSHNQGPVMPVPVGFKTTGYPPSSQGPQGGYPQNYTLTPPGYDDNNIINETQNVGEDGEYKLFDFTEQSIRRAFIRKVYGILMCQLLISMAFIALFLFCEPVKFWAARNVSMLYVAMAVYIAMALLMICCSELRRKAPANFIFLGVFTLATSYMLGVITSCYNVDTVMMAVGITAAVVLALTLFAFQTKYDFTVMGGGLLCALICLILFGFICIFIPSRVMNALYSAAGALIFSLYIVYDTQLMLGGKHKYSITPEEYIFASLNLYLDVINLFLHILSLIGRR